MSVVTGMPQKEVREVVGFDLGHGETALASGAIGSKGIEKLQLHGQYSQLTAIAYRTDGGVVIGERAAQVADAVRFELSFKQRPSNLSGNHSPIADFAKAIHENLLESGELSREGTHFVVGCPSGWPDEELHAYRELLATALPSVDVVRESRAAFMHARSSGRVTLGQLQADVLVIDIGSSTTDITLVTLKHAEHGRDHRTLKLERDLGSTLIDRLILTKSIDVHPQADQLRPLLAQHRGQLAKCELACRRAKEKCFRDWEFYKNEALPVEVGPVIIPVKPEIRFHPTVTAATLEEIVDQPLELLDGLSWRQSFRERLKQAKNILLEDSEPGTIFATGSASRMEFVARDCAEVFPETDFVLDREPEVAIALGLVGCGRFDVQAAKFMDEVMAFLGSPFLRILNRETPDLAARSGKALAQGLTLVVLKPLILAFAERKITKAELQEEAHQTCAEWLSSEEAEKWLQEAVVSWAEEFQSRSLRTPLGRIYRKYDLDFDRLAVQPQFQPRLEGIRIPLPDLADLLDRVSDLIASLMGAVFLGLLARIVMSTPAALLAAVAAAALGLSAGQAKPSEEKMRKYLSEMERKLADEIQRRLLKDERTMHVLRDSIADSLRSEVRAGAEKARELIV